MFYNEKIFKRVFFHKGRYWLNNLKEIPTYFRQLNFLIKHGYDVSARWCTFAWFIDTAGDVLSWHKEHRHGFPMVLDFNESTFEENEEAWDGIIGRMIELLKLMDEENPKYDDMDLKVQYEHMDAAKKEFFDLFSTHFYRLWD